MSDDALMIEELREMIADTTDVLDRPWWVLSVLQDTATLGKYGAMQKMSPLLIEDAGAKALAFSARRLDALLQRETGELSPDRRWSMAESLFTPRQEMQMLLRELEEKAARA